ncbi:MAG: hypothetical protein V7609_20 [Verrucomicrobiota bacterium]
MDAFKVSLVDPLLVLKDVFRQPATKATVQDVIPVIDRLTNALANDNCPGTEIRSEHTKASYLRVRGDAPDDTGHRRAVAENIDSVARLDLDLDTGINYLKIVQQRETCQCRMIDFNSGIDHRDMNAFPSSLFQSPAGFLQSERTGVGR